MALVIMYICSVLVVQGQYARVSLRHRMLFQLSGDTTSPLMQLHLESQRVLSIHAYQT
jgi:hypothetical protein